MIAADQAAQYAVAAAFVVLAALAVLDWFRHRGRSRRWLAAAFVLLAAVGCLSSAQMLWDLPAGQVADVNVALLQASGLVLLLFRSTFLPLSRWALALAALGLGGTAAAAIAAGLPALGTKPNTLQVETTLAVVLAWSVCVLEPTARFWLASNGRPAVQRNRLRALSVGYAGIIVILVAAAIRVPSAQDRPPLVLTLLPLAIVPLLYVSLSPPRWLRELWRRSEEESFRAVMTDILVAPPLPEESARTVLDWAVRFTGADGGAVLDAGGTVLAEATTDPATITALQAAVANGRAAVRRLPGDERAALVCPLPIRDGKGMVALITGPLTPYLDGDVITRLQRYVDVLGAALERGSMIEQLRRQGGQLVEQAHLLDLANDAIMVTRLEDATIRYWNRGAEALYGWTQEEALDRSSIDLLKTAHPELRDGFIAQVRATGHWNGELQQVAKDGRRLVVNSRWTLVKGTGGAPDEVLKLNTDVTAQHEAMEAVRQARVEAEAARDAAEAANNAKSEFLSRVSHELRTPLSAIIGFAELLTHTSELDERQRVFADSVVKAADHLLELVDEVLDLARVESRQMTMSPEPVNIQDLLIGVIEMLRPQADAKEIEMPTTLPPTAIRHVLADRQRLKQVLVNLLSNAVKYNRRGGRVDFPIAVDGDLISIGVSDTGAGIPPEMVDRLFVPFDRLGAERTAVPGTGLGLALSKALVEGMDGELRVQTHEGTGSTFSVVLPTADSVASRSEDGPPIEPAAALRPYAGERTLLYVEDLVSNVRLIEGMAGMRPQVHVLPAMQGQMALELAREHHPDLVLLDLHLPDIPGDEVLARLRTEPATRDIPVVILSADATKGQVDRLLAAGARDYLTKPIRLQAFLDVLDNVFGEAAEDATG